MDLVVEHLLVEVHRCLSSFFPTRFSGWPTSSSAGMMPPYEAQGELPRIPIPRTSVNKIRTWPLLPLPRGLPFPSSAVERPSLVSDKAARLVHDGELGLGRIRELHDGQPLTWNAARQLKKKGPINRPLLSLVLTPIYLSDCPTTVWPPRLVTVHVWDLDLQLPLVSLLFGLVVVV